MTKMGCSITKIAEEVLDFYSGCFTVKNLGGGLLYGNIMTDNDIISFEKTEFEGNEFEIKYSINVNSCDTKKLLRFNIYIISNGGEITIPVFIKVLKDVFYTKDGYKFNTIKDFFSYYKKKPKKATEIFYSAEFFNWLIKMGFEHMDMTKLILEDCNRDRAIENFFIFTKLKKQNFTEVIEKNINISIKPFQTKLLSGSIVILKKGYGYIHKELSLKYNSKWIKLKKNIITSDDFDDENRCYVNYEINPKLIDSNFSREFVIIDKNTDVKIDILKLPKIKVSLSNEIYEYDDYGSIIVENNCGEDLFFEFDSKNNFVEFEEKRCVIS